MLPLQETIVFKPASVKDASDYLHCMMISEGYTSSLDHMRSLCKTSRKGDPLEATDDLLRSRVVSDEQPLDLRQAINNLHFLCQAVPGFEDPIPAPRHSDDTEELLAGTLGLEDALNALGPQLSLASPSTGVFSLQKLWRISDSLSAVESQLARSPGDILKVVLLRRFTETDLKLIGICG